jgi:hypothetical protein
LFPKNILNSLKWKYGEGLMDVKNKLEDLNKKEKYLGRS